MAQSPALPSDSNMSSPLSDVEENEADPSEPGFDPTEARDDDEDDDDNEELSAAEDDGDGDDESNLAEDEEEEAANDTEAETERLQDTPEHPSLRRRRDVIVGKGGTSQTFERSPLKAVTLMSSKSPTKPRGPAAAAAAAAAGEDDSDDNSDDDLSLPLSSHPSKDDLSSAGELAAGKARSIKGKISASGKKRSSLLQQHDADNRKRKRSLAADGSESEQPLRKRTGSVVAQRDNSTVPTGADSSGEGGGTGTGTGGTTTTSSNTQSGDHSVDGDDDRPAGGAEHDGEVDDEELPLSARAKPAKPTAGDKKPRSAAPDELTKAAEAGGGGGDGAEATGAVEDGHVASDDEGHEDEPDHEDEADSAARNEEELAERKRAAHEQIAMIERHFAAFRERLFDERLDQLHRELAMLEGDNPTHPDFVAVVSVLEARRDEQQARLRREYDMKVENIRRWSVAQRAQAHSKFAQTVRDLRERQLEAIGRALYQIHHERRREAAGMLPEFELRLPASRQAQVRQAVAYNTEVSILSGFARHRGFPAGPGLRGASAAEMEDDFEAITHRSRQLAQQQPRREVVVPEVGVVPFGAQIGAAGAQFLAKTVWANPNHPAHLARQRQAQHVAHEAAYAVTHPGMQQAHHQGLTPAAAGGAPVPHAAKRKSVGPTRADGPTVAEEGTGGAAVAGK